MPRVRLAGREGYEFVYRTAVRVGHINYAGHAGHDALVRMVWEARVDLLDSLGLSELDLGDGRTGLIMQDLVVNFLGEAFRRDVLEIATHVGEMRPAGFRMFHRISCGERAIALMEIGFAAFDYALRRIAPVPEGFVRAVAARAGRSPGLLPGS